MKTESWGYLASVLLRALGPWVLVLSLVVVVQTACFPAQPAGAPAVSLPTADVAAFAGARVALALLDAAETARLDAMPRANPEELAAAGRRVLLLQSARNDLEAYRQWLLTGKGPNGIDVFRRAVKALVTVDATLRASGIRVPSEVSSALAAAEAL